LLGKLFRGKYLYYLKKSYNEGKLRFLGKIKKLKILGNFNRLLSESYAKEWVVYSKKPFSNPINVFEYLGRYTHRVAISNSRIVDVERDKVSFRWKDYRDDNKNKIMKIDALEFIRRFLLHVLPKGFKRIRFYGIFSNRYKKENLKKIRELLEVTEEISLEIKRRRPELILDLWGIEKQECPECHSNNIRIEEIPPEYVSSQYWDTA